MNFIKPDFTAKTISEGWVCTYCLTDEEKRERPQRSWSPAIECERCGQERLCTLL